MKPIPRSATLAIIGALALGATAVLLWNQLRGDAAPVGLVDGPPSATPLRFSDETLSLGALAEHRQGDDHLTGLDESLGSGSCALDYDNDGWVDLFVVNGSGDTRYYGRRHWWQRSLGPIALSSALRMRPSSR